MFQQVILTLEKKVFDFDRHQETFASNEKWVCFSLGFWLYSYLCYNKCNINLELKIRIKILLY